MRVHVLLSRYRSQHGRPLHPPIVVFARVRLLSWYQPIGCYCRGTSPQPATIATALPHYVTSRTSVTVVAPARTPITVVVCSPLAHYISGVCASEQATALPPYLVARAPLSAPHSERIQLPAYSQFVVLSRSLRSLPPDDNTRSLRSLCLMMCAFTLASLSLPRSLRSLVDKLRIASLAHARQWGPHARSARSRLMITHGRFAPSRLTIII